MPSATTTSNESRRHSHHVEGTLYLRVTLFVDSFG